MGGEMAAKALRFAQDWAALATAAGALAMLFWGKGPMSALGRWRDAVLGAAFRPLFAGVRAEKLGQAILLELKTNGGASLKDAVLRIEDNQIRGNSLMHLMLTQDDAVAAFMTDGAGLYDWISPAHHRLTGRSLDDVRGWGWLAFVHVDDAEHVREAWVLAVKGGWPFSTRFRVVRADGAVVPVHGTANPLRAGPRVIGWSGLVTIEDAP